jgi:hypothetical protein
MLKVKIRITPNRLPKPAAVVVAAVVARRTVAALAVVATAVAVVSLL